MEKDPLQVITEYGFQLSDKGVQFVKDMDPENKKNPIPYMLNTHMSQYSKAFLPEDKYGLEMTLNGKFILQIMNVINITTPRITTTCSDSSRVLRVRLTDGTTSMYGIELERVPQLKLDTPPGTKVLLTNPEIVNGRIMLRPSNITILGGMVQEVYEYWKNQEMMAMKNKYRQAIRDASLSPPKFISFTDYIKQRKKPAETKPSQPQKPAETKPSQPQKPVSGTAGVLPEMKKLEELDLEKITDLRKEALDGIDPDQIKEMGKWGSSKSNEKKPVPRHAPPRSQKGEEPPTRTVRSHEPKPTPQVVETKRKAKLVDIMLNGPSQEIVCMLQIEKSVVTLPVTKRLYTYLLCCSDDGESLMGIREEIVGDEFDFGFISENGNEKISSLNDSDLIIPPPDYEVTEDNKQAGSNRPARAFFKRPSRRRGRGGRHYNPRGRPPSRGGHGSRGRGRPNFFVF